MFRGSAQSLELTRRAIYWAERSYLIVWEGNGFWRLTMLGALLLRRSWEVLLGPRGGVCRECGTIAELRGKGRRGVRGVCSACLARKAGGR